MKHVVIIVQENHTFDTHFGHYCTAAAGSNPTCTDGPACCEAIPATDPIYGSEINGRPITSVRVRKERPDGKGPDSEYRDAAPYLEGIRINGRWVAIYSKYDIGCALENHQSSDCVGHDKDSALRLAAAAVLYELKK